MSVNTGTKMLFSVRCHFWECFFIGLFWERFFIGLFWERWMKHSPLVYADPPHTTFETEILRMCLSLGQKTKYLSLTILLAERDTLVIFFTRWFSCDHMWSSVIICDHLWSSVIIFTSGLSSLLYKHGARQEWQVVKLSSLKKVLNTTSWKYWGTLGKKQNGELSHVVADTSLIFGDTVVRWSTPAW